MYSDHSSRSSTEKLFSKAYKEIERIYKATGAENKCKMLIAEGGHRFFAEQGWSEMLKLIDL